MEAFPRHSELGFTPADGGVNPLSVGLWDSNL